MEINDLCHRVQFPARDGEVQGLFCFVCGKKVAWTRAMAVTDGRVPPSKTTSGQIRAASYPRSAARQRTFAVQVFVVSLRMKSNHKSYFFWQMDICKFLFFKKLNEPFPVAFCDICKGLLRLLEFIDRQESHIITWNTRIFSVQHLIYILSCIPPV